MKTLLMAFAAVGAALTLTPASAQVGSPYGSPYRNPYRPAAGHCADGHCSHGHSHGTCADRCGCEPGACEAGRCGPGCDMTACGCRDGACSDGGCADGTCGSAGPRPFAPGQTLPRRPFVDPAPAFGRLPGRPARSLPSPFMADGQVRRNW